MKITVRIGAAIDGDLSKILYEPLAASAARARGKVRSEAGAMAAEQVAVKKSQLATERQLIVQQKRHELALERDAERQKVREHERTVEEKKRLDQRAAADSVRAAKQRVRDEERELKDRAKGVRSFASSATGTAAGVVRRGVGVAADIARGAGVEFDIAGGVRKRVNLEAQAMELANAGYVEGDMGAAGRRADPRAIMADIQRVGETYGIAQEDLSKSLDSFVGKTGELQTGRDMLESFAKVAKATGADTADIAAAAGAISNKLGDIPDKAAAINKVMLAIAGQGKVGAVEIKDLATQMEKLTSQASKFQSNATLRGLVGTDTGANIAMLGVLAQAARKTEKGSAAQATQSAMAFIRDLTGQTATKRIGAKTIFADKEKNQLRDPQEIIKDLISKTKGDQTKLAYLMSNQNSRAVVNAFMDPYMAAYKGTKGSAKEKDAAGRKAVDEAFDKLKAATLSPEAQNAAVAQAMTTTATKVEQFQQKLDRVVGDMADQVIPALVKLAPTALQAANGLSKVAVWAAEHPAGALGAAAGAGLAKALGDQLAAAVATRVGTALAAVATRVGTALAGSMALSGLTVATLMIATVGMMAIDHVVKEADKASKGQFATEMEGVNALTEMKAARQQYEAEAAKGEVSAETKSRLQKAKEAAFLAKYDLEQRSDLGLRTLQERDQGAGGEGLLARLAGYTASKVTGEEKDFQKEATALGAAWNTLLENVGLDPKGILGSGNGQNSSEYEKGEAAARNYSALQEEMAALQREMSNVTRALSGTLTVSVEGGLPPLPGNVTGP